MKKGLFVLAILICCQHLFAKESPVFFAANNAGFLYMGRIDFSDPLKPTFWATAAQVQFKFKGDKCTIVVTDEVQYGKNHNYIDIVVDNNYKRIQLKEVRNEISIGENLSASAHNVTISKSSEAGIGFIKFEGAYCQDLATPQALPTRKIEFFGDSITSGGGSDTSVVGCHKGEWYDQTNGYMTYGAITARNLNAQYNITSASGIGLIHSCCNMDVVMPQVYDKVSLRENKIPWDFSKYQPDVVSICLGQNDGIQDSVTYCGAYVKFIKDLRKVYPKATIICLSSPMADPTLMIQTRNYLPSIKAATRDKKVNVFYFSRRFSGGCDTHPSLAEHKIIADEYTAFIKKKMRW